MGKRCSPGVICIEYITLTIYLILGGIILYLMFPKEEKKENNLLPSIRMPSIGMPSFGMPSFGISSNIGVSTDIRDLSQERDRFNDPYSPPLTNNLGMPVNIRTQRGGGNYQQMGILTKKSPNNDSTILPLMGREVNSGRDKWNFYTMNDKNNMIKLPVTYKKKSCSGEYGCDNIYNGDTVYVEGYNDTFNVTMYENNSLQYIPYL